MMLQVLMYTVVPQFFPCRLVLRDQLPRGVLWNCFGDTRGSRVAGE